MGLAKHVIDLDLDCLLHRWKSWIGICPISSSSESCQGKLIFFFFSILNIAHSISFFIKYKTFQWGDVVANLMGSGVGLFFSYHAERRYRTRREIERLYEPLDQDLYDDDEDVEEEEREEEAGGGINAWKSLSSNRESNGKKVRFGENEIVQQGSPKHNGNLFRTHDDDEDGDVWRSAHEEQ